MKKKKASSFTVNDRALTEEQAGPPPEVGFASCIASLTTMAQVNRGNVPDPETGLTAPSLAAAKQFIDIAGMLRDKTKGNFSEQEQERVENVLFTLRMQYVKALEGKK